MQRRTLTLTLALPFALARLVAGQTAADMAKAAGTGLQDGKPIEGPATWETTVAVGATMTDGNSDTVNSTGRVASEKLHGSTLAAIVVEGAYGESTTEDGEGNEQTEQTVGNAKAAVTLKQRLDGIFLYGGVGAEHDGIAEVDYRATGGLGLGTFLVDNDTVRLAVEGGAGYLFEEVADVEDDYATMRLAERIDYRLSETAKCWQSLEYLPEAADVDNYLMTAEAGVEAAINSTMSLGVIAKYKYDSTPGEGLQKDDTSLTAQVSVRL